MINLSNIVMGGAIQVAKSFMSELNKIDNPIIYAVIYNPKIIEFDSKYFSNKFKFIEIFVSPSKLISRRRVVRELESIEKNFNPEIVFTLFGPSYWIPKNKHVCGFADGWVYNQKSIAYNKLRFFQKIKRILLNHYKLYRLRKESSNFILETEDAKKKFKKVLNKKSSNYYVVSNSYNPVFNKKNQFFKLNTFDNESFNLLTISSYYPHKNLEVINNLATIIPENEKVKFYLTLPNDIFNLKFITHENIINLGSQKIEECPNLYHNCDAVFLPTILETFSASYIEAMVMKKPILTSNLDFANQICGKSGEYFEPFNLRSIVKKILTLKKNKKRYNQLVKLGSERIKIYPNPRQKAIDYLKICKKIIYEDF